MKHNIFRFIIIVLILIGLFFGGMAIRSQVLFDKVVPVYISICSFALIFSGVIYDKYRKYGRTKKEK